MAAALVLAEDCVADVADAVGSLGLALAGSLEFAEVGSVNCWMVWGVCASDETVDA